MYLLASQESRRPGDAPLGRAAAVDVARADHHVERLRASPGTWGSRAGGGRSRRPSRRRRRSPRGSASPFLKAAITAAPRPPFSPRSSSSTRPGNSAMASRTASPVPSGLPSSATQTSTVFALGEDLPDQRARRSPARCRSEPPPASSSSWTAAASGQAGNGIPNLQAVHHDAQVARRPRPRHHVWTGRQAGTSSRSTRRPWWQRIGRRSACSAPLRTRDEGAEGHPFRETATRADRVAGRFPAEAAHDQRRARPRARQVDRRAGPGPAVA